MVFYDNDRQDIPSQYKMPPYLTASVRDVDLRNAMIDPRSSLNIIFLEVVGVP